VSDYSDSHQLLAVVSSVHHEGVGEALNDGTLCFSESLCGISACGMGDIDGLADLDVVAESTD
jgi:hypothetical protein